MKHIIIGDLHGNLNLFNKVNKFIKSTDEYKVVFLGDYVDSRQVTWDGGQSPAFGRKKQQELLKTMMYEYEPEKMTYLIGNHDLQYMIKSHLANPFQCSGYSAGAGFSFYPYYEKMMDKKILKFYHSIDNLLCTHAGLDGDIFKQLPNTKQVPFEEITIDDINETLKPLTNDMYLYVLSSGNRNSEVKPLFDIGYISGGYKSGGGIFWLRPSEITVPTATNKNIIQIFGHTSNIHGLPLHSPYYLNPSLILTDTSLYKYPNEFIVYDDIKKEIIFEKFEDFFDFNKKKL